MHIFLGTLQFALPCTLPASRKQLRSIPLRKGKQTLGKRSPLYDSLYFTPRASSLLCNDAQRFPSYPTTIHTTIIRRFRAFSCTAALLHPVHCIAPFMFIHVHSCSFCSRSPCIPYVHSVHSVHSTPVFYTLRTLLTAWTSCGLGPCLHRTFLKQHKKQVSKNKQNHSYARLCQTNPSYLPSLFSSSL